ncbi:MAG: hypothetical protein AVDCRST_MAG31-766 [uncultured Sphingomonas sp.]|uniref:Uncharacterized protein n=1 Tax=uncultured Sphingomonas sp. TaxID=158754 RepID=A0A6J4SXF0_9SPHN|nr:MAG: hypothetical protein AVDCRST_MAG31-766 [uncultured Sphingomonas sp.]
MDAMDGKRTFEQPAVGSDYKGRMRSSAVRVANHRAFLREDSFAFQQ